MFKQAKLNFLFCITVTSANCSKVSRNDKIAF